MVDDQPEEIISFRTLYDELLDLDYHGWRPVDGLGGRLNRTPHWGQSVTESIDPTFAPPPNDETRAVVREAVTSRLERWAIDPRVHRAMAELQRYRARNHAANPYEVRPVDLWELYALSRLSDYLLLSFQAAHDEPQPVPAITKEAYVEFFEAVGFRAFHEPTYSPFFHEIAAVEPAADRSAGIELVEELWPGLLFGDMLFARAGVRVRAHRAIVRPDVPTGATLYWSHRRQQRPTCDLSHSWGHNSQWRTSIRRDYVEPGFFHLNVDGEIDIGGSVAVRTHGEGDPDRTDPPIDERRHLLVNRCFLHQPVPSDEGDRIPWDDYLTLPRDHPLVR